MDFLKTDNCSANTSRSLSLSDLDNQPEECIKDVATKSTIIYTFTSSLLTVKIIKQCLIPFLCLRKEPSGSWQRLLDMKCDPWVKARSSKSRSCLAPGIWPPSPAITSSDISLRWDERAALVKLSSERSPAPPPLSSSPYNTVLYND